MKFDEQKILFMNKTEISAHNVDDLHSLKLNNWKGWQCSAGTRSLYIQHDGMVYRATCSVNGVIGNIYNENFISRVLAFKTWVTCVRDVCACGSDMQAPKVKNIEDTYIVGNNGSYSKIDYEKLQLVDHVQDAEIVFCGTFKDYRMVIWEIGRRCNYDCWYCVPDSHNNYESHKSFGSLKHGLENLSQHWAKGEKMKFVFTGGEPTFNPDFLEFVTYLKTELFHINHTTTNGSNTTDYYRNLMKVSDIGFSAHLNYLENPKVYNKFLVNIEACVKIRETDSIANMNWLGVRIMLQPGKLEFAKKLYKDCVDIIDNITIDLLHSKDRKIMDYSIEEIDWLKEVNKL
jgi:organic radical activating enzyme